MRGAQEKRITAQAVTPARRAAARGRVAEYERLELLVIIDFAARAASSEGASPADQTCTPNPPPLGDTPGCHPRVSDTYLPTPNMAIVALSIYSVPLTSRGVAKPSGQMFVVLPLLGMRATSR